MINYTSNGTPSEDDEEHTLVEFCDLKGWKHTHFSNETFTTSWKQKMKMKYLGVHSGVPDHLVIVKRKDGTTVPAYVEMKREKGGTISDTQYDWIEALLQAGQFVAACEGGREAVKFITAVENNDTKTINEFVEKFEKKREKRLKNLEKSKNQKKQVVF